jgi:hypothetical protein
MITSSKASETAVDAQDLPGHVTRGLRAKIDNRIGDIFRLADAP